MNICRYKIDTEALESIRKSEGVSMDNFRYRFIKEDWYPISATTYLFIKKKWICSFSVMLSIKKVYPTVVGFLTDKK